MLSLGQGRKEEAIRDYSKAIDINPQYGNAYSNRGYYFNYLLGNALDDLGRKEEAIKD